MNDNFTHLLNSITYINNKKCVLCNIEGIKLNNRNLCLSCESCITTLSITYNPYPDKFKILYNTSIFLTKESLRINKKIYNNISKKRKKIK